MTIVEKQFESIGILPVGETNPQIFLREPKHSFEYPVWSHSGDWIAFRQTDYGIHTDRPGIVRRDGTGKKIPDPIFGCMSPPTWSADDRLLGSIICTESGELPIVIDIETEMIFELFPNTRPRFSNSFPSQFGVSPKTMQAIFMGLVKGNPQSRELWLLNLDGSKQEQLSIPTEMATGCYEFPNLIAWSPDGEAFLVEFYEVDETECRASLWLYDLSNKTWLQVIQQSRISYDRLGEGIYWSSNGLWIAWARMNGASIYSADNWKMQRYVDFTKGVDAHVFNCPWVIDENGNEIFTIYRNFSIPELTNTKIDIWGISPNGTEADDQLLFKIEAKEPPWIPLGSFSPGMWQP